MRTLPKKQRGVTLLVGLIMLILLTLMAVTAYNLGKGNQQVVGNMQFHNSVMRVAEQQVEKAISSPGTITTTFTAAPAPTTTPDGYKVSVWPQVVQAYVKKNNAINLNDANQVGCTLGTKQDFGVAGASVGNSLCAQALYDVQVITTDPATNATVTINQGVAVQVPADSVCSIVNSCG